MSSNPKESPKNSKKAGGYLKHQRKKNRKRADDYFRTQRSIRDTNEKRKTDGRGCRGGGNYGREEIPEWVDPDDEIPEWADRVILEIRGDLFQQTG